MHLVITEKGLKTHMKIGMKTANKTMDMKTTNKTMDMKTYTTTTITRTRKTLLLIICLHKLYGYIIILHNIVHSSNVPQDY